MSGGLTQRESDCLKALVSLTVGDVSPTLDDLKDALGLQSKSNVHRLLVGLEERGFITKSFRKPRSVRVIPERDGVLPRLADLDVEALRTHLATAAGLLAHKTSEAHCDVVLRRIADLISHKPMVAA